MHVRRLWVGLLCICFALMLFDNLNAQERRRRPRGGMQRWKGPPIGTEVRDFELPLLDGGSFKLSEKRGTIIVIELGACT